MSEVALLTQRNRLPGERIGTGFLIAGGVFLVAGIPALYGCGWIGITTVNQLGRFLAVVIAAIGLDLVWGYTGILSLCQAMFFCLGGYAIGMHMALHGPLDGSGIPRCLFVVSSDVNGFALPWFWAPFRSLPVAVLLGLLVPALFAGAFAYFTFRSRVRGVYFSIITQATTVAAVMVLSMNNMRLCGTNGLTNFVTLAGFDLQSRHVKLGLYVLTALLLVGVYLAARWITLSRLGRVLLAVRDNESRLRFAGFQPVAFKVFIFVVGALAAGLGGMLYTPQNGIITPAKMKAEESIILVAYVAVGGRGTLSGAVLGTLSVSYLYSLLTSGVFYDWVPAFLKIQTVDDRAGVMGVIRQALQKLLGAEAWPLLLGFIFILITLLFPEGIVGGWRRIMAWMEARRTARLGGAVPKAAAAPLAPAEEPA